MSLFVMGAVAPQDPLTGVIIGKPWLADRNYPQADRNYRVPELPLQSGLIVSDAIQELPPVFAVDFLLSDIATTVHPIRSFPKRSTYLALTFKTIEQRRGPVTLWCNGYAPVRDLAIESVSPRQQGSVTDPGTASIIMSVRFKRMQFTTLYVVPIAVDVELIAAGITPL